jgi:hypothetical protein
VETFNDNNMFQHRHTDQTKAVYCTAIHPQTIIAGYIDIDPLTIQYYPGETLLNGKAVQIPDTSKMSVYNDFLICGHLDKEGQLVAAYRVRAKDIPGINIVVWAALNNEKEKTENCMYWLAGFMAKQAQEAAAIAGLRLESTMYAPHQAIEAMKRGGGCVFSETYKNQFGTGYLNVATWGGYQQIENHDVKIGLLEPVFE